jgi:hypothetical protein
MARCWTCGSTVSGWQYTCSACKGLKELKTLRKKVESYEGAISTKFSYMSEVQREGYYLLKDTLTHELSSIASVIEWGFEKTRWQLVQQTNILKSIDHTLKTPSETKANEWREMAERLKSRGVLDESEKFYLRALELKPLDFRIYVGLAETYLRMNKPDEAKYYMEKSLPHAPKKEIDYRSYSYRLIGHIYECKEKYNQAASILYSAIELSPNYADGHYDYARYCAKTGEIESCLSSLQKAILAKPLFYYLAREERDFYPSQYIASCTNPLNEVQDLLTQIEKKTYREAKKDISSLEGTLALTGQAVSKTNEALKKARGDLGLECNTTYEEAKSEFKRAKDKLASKDYVESLKAKSISEHSRSLANQAKKEAESSAEYWERKYDEKISRAWRKVPIALIVIPLMFGIISGMGGCVVGLFSGNAGRVADIGFILGIILGIIIGIFKIRKELQ